MTFLQYVQDAAVRLSIGAPTVVLACRQTQIILKLTKF